MEIFYREKNISRREKIRKNDFPLSEKFPCYAPGRTLNESTVPSPGTHSLDLVKMNCKFHNCHQCIRGTTPLA